MVAVLKYKLYFGEGKKTFSTRAQILLIFQDSYRVFSPATKYHILRFIRAFSHKFRCIIVVETMRPWRKQSKNDNATMHLNVR